MFDPVTHHTHCDDCLIDMGNHTRNRPPMEDYAVLITESDRQLCAACWLARHGLEPITVTYTPRVFVMPDETAQPSERKRAA